MKKIIKKALALTGHTIAKSYARNVQDEKQISRDDFFELYFSMIKPEDFFFVQIGAHDGKADDPLYEYVTKYRLRGIAVEPQPDVFQRLVENYRGYAGVQCVNAAVAEKTGSMTLYTVKESAKNEENFIRMTRIASFSQEAIKLGLKKKIPPGADPEQYIQKTVVNALSFDDLVKEYGVTKIDFLQLDCEGYDYEILKLVDLQKFAPKIINFESDMFSDAVRKECEEMLTARGYRFFRAKGDTCAYKL